MKQTFDSAVAAKWVCAAIAARWINTPATMQALLVLMALDYVTGLGAAVARREVSSAIAYRGLIKKLLVLLLLLAVHWMEILVHREYGIEHVGAISFGITEGISIVENAARGGAPIPEKLVLFLLVAKKLWPVATPEQVKGLDD